MPPRKEVTTLLNLSLQAVRGILSSLCKSFLDAEHTCVTANSKIVDALKLQLCKGVPHMLQDKIAQQFLSALDTFYKDYSGVSAEPLICEAIVRQLAAIVPHLKLKELIFDKWSKPIQLALLEDLEKITCLEVLDCGSSHFDTKALKLLRRKLLDFKESFSKLTSFTYQRNCSTKILQTIAQSCKNFLRKVNVTDSRRVEDSVIRYLCRYEGLEDVNLQGTKVSMEGYYDLVSSFELKNLTNVYEVFDHCMLYFCRKACLMGCDLSLKHLMYDNPGSSTFEEIHDYFPSLEELTLFRVDASCDFSCLSEFEELVKIGLSNSTVANNINELLSVKGSALRSLLLDEVKGLQAGLLVKISESCPNLETLILSDCPLSGAVEFPVVNQPSQVFQKLTKLVIISNFCESLVKFILSHAQNIKVIKLVDLNGVTDDFFSSVFMNNNLKQLESLEIDCIHEISLKMLKHIITFCDQISSLGNFSDKVSDADLKNLQDFIISNNFNVELKFSSPESN